MWHGSNNRCGNRNRRLSHCKCTSLKTTCPPLQTNWHRKHESSCKFYATTVPSAMWLEITLKDHVYSVTEIATDRTKISADAEGPRNVPQIWNIALENACNSRMTFKDNQAHYHCYSISCSSKSRLVLSFWYWLTWVVKRVLYNRVVNHPQQVLVDLNGPHDALCHTMSSSCWVWLIGDGCRSTEDKT